MEKRRAHSRTASRGGLAEGGSRERGPGTHSRPRGVLGTDPEAGAARHSPEAERAGEGRARAESRETGRGVAGRGVQAGQRVCILSKVHQEGPRWCFLGMNTGGCIHPTATLLPLGLILTTLKGCLPDLYHQIPAVFRFESTHRV